VVVVVTVVVVVVVVVTVVVVVVVVVRSGLLAVLRKMEVAKEGVWGVGVISMLLKVLTAPPLPPSMLM
jgi:hypothetical protein